MLKLPWKSEIYSHLLVAFIYFFLVSVLRLGLGGLGMLGMLEMWEGAILGTFFLDIDHLVYWFVTHTEKEDSKEAREIVTGRTRGTRGIRRIREIIKELYELGQKTHKEHVPLIFHSVIGQIIVFVLAVFVLTSGGSIFGSAFIMAVNLHLLKDEWSDFVKNKERLADWLFWQINDAGIKKYAREYLIGASLLFLGLTRFIL